MFPSKTQIEAIIVELQKIMRLQDWDIKLSYLSAVEMYRDTGDISTIADCLRSRPHHLATIKMCYEADKTSNVVGNWYLTLVHEMFHILIDEFDYATEFKVDHDDYSLPKERLVCNLARMFVKLYPEKNFDSILNNQDNECKTE